MLVLWKNIGKPLDEAMRHRRLPQWVTRLYGRLLRRILVLYFASFQKNTANHYVVSTLTNGDVFIDIGANDGSIVRLASGGVGSSGRVYAFEPQRNIYETLCKVLVRFGWDNVTAFQTVVGDYDGEVTFFEFAEMDKFSSLAQNWVGKEAKAVQYPILRLDTWMKTQSLTRIDLIKIDVEGAELKVLQGSQETLKHYTPVVLLEIGHHEQRQVLFDYTIDDLLSAFRTIGYNHFFVLTPTGLQQFQSARELQGGEQDMVAMKD